MFMFWSLETITFHILFSMLIFNACICLVWRDLFCMLLELSYTLLVIYIYYTDNICFFPIKSINFDILERHKYYSWAFFFSFFFFFFFFLIPFLVFWGLHGSFRMDFSLFQSTWDSDRHWWSCVSISVVILTASLVIPGHRVSRCLCFKFLVAPSSVFQLKLMCI